MRSGPLTGTLLDDRYLVGEVVGAGGFGVVYEATHVGLASKVALKVPRVDDLPTSKVADLIARFIEEGRTLKLLRHPSLAGALDVGLLPPDEQGLALPFIVLEWCEGPTLEEWRARRPGRMSPASAWAALRPAFAAVAHAHRAGVVHRDITPANVVMEATPDGGTAPRVIDFGTAKVVTPRDAADDTSGPTSTTHRAFTARYAAPEQLAGLPTGPRTDVYGLALLLLETIAGRPVHASDEDAHRALIDGDLPTPSKLGLDLAAWSPILERALAPAPEDRYADAGALIAALDAAPAAAEAPAHDVEGAPEEAAIAQRPHGADPGGRENLDAEETGAPSSHTLLTRRDATPTIAPADRRPWRGAARKGALLLTLALGVAGSVGAWRAWGGGAPSAPPDRRDTTGGSTVSAAAATPPAASAPLRALSAEELVARAKNAGLTQCDVVRPIKATSLLLCSDGWGRLEHDVGAPRDPAWLRHEVQYLAKAMAAGGRGARFTVHDDVSLVIAAPAEIVDRVFASVVDGYAHGAVGTERPPPIAIEVPARLADWRGAEILARAEALGFDVSGVELRPRHSTVGLIHRGRTGSLTLISGPPSAWLASLEKVGSNFAYATDGEVTLVSIGESPIGDVDTVEQVLGRSRARVVQRGRSGPSAGGRALNP